MKSRFQENCTRYFAAVREIHSAYYTFNKVRRDAELLEHRFQSTDPNVRNIFSFIEVLHALLKDRPTPNGVDLGCGSHFFVDHLIRHYGWKVVGYDSDSRAIELARSNFQDSASQYRCHDLLEGPLPIAEGSLDFVICNSLIQHFSRTETDYVLREACRVLSKQGFLLLVFKKPAHEPAPTADSAANFRNADEPETRLVDPAIHVALRRTHQLAHFTPTGDLSPDSIPWQRCLALRHAVATTYKVPWRDCAMNLSAVKASSTAR